MASFSMCPEYACEKRETCLLYRAVNSGKRQLYMIGRGNIGERCIKYVEIKKGDYVSPDKLSNIDEENRERLLTWQGIEYE